MIASPVQRLLSRFAKVEPGENAVVVAAFLLFFFVLGSYFAVRPVRETVKKQIDNGGRKKREDLADEEAADHDETEGLPQFRAGARGQHER